LKKKVFKYLK